MNINNLKTIKKNEAIERGLMYKTFASKAHDDACNRFKKEVFSHAKYVAS